MRFSIIPSAGLATRFLPASKCIPKEMFPVLNKPSIQYVVEEAVSAGSKSIVFVSSPDKESVLDHFDTINPKFPLEKLAEKTQKEICDLNNLIEIISVRQKTPKGLGHAVLKGASVTEDNSFSVLLPDMLLFPRNNISSMKKINEFYKKTKTSVVALMKVPENRKHLYGVVEGKKIEKNVVEISKLLEKPSSGETDSCLALVGRYIFTATIKPILKKIKLERKKEVDLAYAMNELLKVEKIYGMIIDDDSIVFDTGKSEGFVLANTYIGIKSIPHFKDSLKKLLEETK